MHPSIPAQILASVCLMDGSGLRLVNIQTIRYNAISQKDGASSITKNINLRYNVNNNIFIFLHYYGYVFDESINGYMHYINICELYEIESLTNVKPQSLVDYITAIQPLGNDKLLIGTNKYGLFLFNEKSG